MRKHFPTLIKPPLTWRTGDAPVAPPVIPVLAERGGTQLNAPRATIVVDTREQNPFDFSRFEGLVRGGGEAGFDTWGLCDCWAGGSMRG